MANHLAITLEKPLQHLGLADWSSRLTQIRNVADARREEAFHLRQSSTTLRNEARTECRWNNYNSNVALSDRIEEIKRWRINVQNLMIRLEREIKALQEEKSATKQVNDAMIGPLQVVSECLTTRDCRLGPELTYDEPENELKKELCVVENNIRLLQDQIQAAWEKLNRLEDVKFKLYLEIDNKVEAENIDGVQLELNKFSANLTFKPNPLRNPKKSTTYEGWLEHTKNMEQLAENELADTYAIRESLFVCREKAKNTLKAQQDRTEHTLRKRIFETQRSRNELKYQKIKMNEEMEKVICEIKKLEQAFRDKSNPLKLAESRLESRAIRSGMELCLDEPHEKLIAEVQELRKIRKSLQDKIDCTKTIFSALEEHAIKIDEDLMNKEHSLMTDIRAIDLRARLRPNVENPSQTDRNIQFTNIEDEIPKV